MRIAVVGGTGTVGAKVVTAGRASGHEVVVIARSAGVDVVTGAGLDEALDGVEAIIDTSNLTTNSPRKAAAFFRTAARTVEQAGARAGVGHLVVLSIVGIDRVPLGYYRGKLVQEQAVAEGSLPWTIVRATQFHEFAGQVLGRVPGPVAVVPRMRSATVAADEVATHLVRVAAAAPAGMAAEFAGPDVHEMPDLARRLLAARGARRLVIGMRLPGRAGARMADDGLLPSGEDTVRGTQTFDDWLAHTA